METLGRYLAFSGATLGTIPSLIQRPGAVWVSAWHYVAGSWLLALAMGLTGGLVAWMHIHDVLQRLEAASLLPSFLTAAVVLEFGPVSVGLLAASRLASGISAELASMTQTEQVDALEIAGVSPIASLVTPRVAAVVLVLPPLTVVVDYSALWGSFAAEWMAGSLSWSAYWRAATDALRPGPVILATLKTTVFGFLVGTIACWHGLSADRSTESVGRAATTAVLHSTLAILLANVFLVRVIQLIT